MTWFLFKIIVPILVIGVLILVHELGHFLVAKWCGVGVVKFSIGFGPVVFKWKRGETVYQLCAIPLGGFVRMVGDIPDALTGPQSTDEAVRQADADDVPPELLADRSRWFVEKSLFQRSAIVFAGPFFNFISAVAFIVIAALLYGEMIPLKESRIGEVVAGGPAAAAGLLDGDLVLRIGEKPVSTWDEFSSRIYEGPDVATPLVVRRGETTVELSVTPKKGTVNNPAGGSKEVFLIGVTPATETRAIGFVDALEHGVLWTYTASARTLEGIGGMLFGNISPKELAGPIFIFDAASKQAQKGFEYLLYLMALLSVSLAVLNLLPVPVLDGGHLLFFFIEALVGPISTAKKEMAQQVGFILLIGLMGYAITNDLRREVPSEAPSPISWSDETAPNK